MLYFTCVVVFIVYQDKDSRIFILTMYQTHARQLLCKVIRTLVSPMLLRCGKEHLIVAGESLP